MTMEELSNVKGRGWDDVDVCLKADVVIRWIALNSDSNHSTRIFVAILGKLGSEEGMQLVQLKQLGTWAVGFFFEIQHVVRGLPTWLRCRLHMLIDNWRQMASAASAGVRQYIKLW